MPDYISYPDDIDRTKPFFKYDKSRTRPPRAFLEGFLKICEFARKSKIRLNSQFIKDEQRAYLSLKNGEYNA